MESKTIFYYSIVLCLFIGVDAKPRRNFEEKPTDKESSAVNLFTIELHAYQERFVLIHRYKDGNKTVDDCQIYGTRAVREVMQSKFEDLEITDYSNKTVTEFQRVLSECKATQKHNKKDYLVKFNKLKGLNKADYLKMSQYFMTTGNSREKRFIGDVWDHGLDALLIYPGTNWCGAGNIADNYDDLGEDAEEDACCRAHDHCEWVIRSGKTDDTSGLTNNGRSTRCHCDCDKTFRDCLKRVSSFDSWMIGNLFFDLIDMLCFQFDHPWGCIDKSWFGWCWEYGRETDRFRRWHFTDELEY